MRHPHFGPQAEATTSMLMRDRHPLYGPCQAQLSGTVRHYRLAPTPGPSRGKVARRVLHHGLHHRRHSGPTRAGTAVRHSRAPVQVSKSPRPSPGQTYSGTGPTTIAPRIGQVMARPVKPITNDTE